MNQSTLRQLPNAWVERIFARMASMYGERFSNMWKDIPKNELLSAWAEALGGFDEGQIRQALKDCEGLPFPPTLPGFKTLCNQYQPIQPIALALPNKPFPPMGRTWKEQQAYAAARIAEIREKFGWSEGNEGIFGNVLDSMSKFQDMKLKHKPSGKDKAGGE